MNVRGGKIIIGFAFKTMYRILSIVIAFFMMPFLLRVLGDKMYGLWILSGAFLAYMGYLDLGISSAVARFVARAVGQKDIKEINEVVNTSFVIYIFIGLATLLVTIALIAFLALFIKSEPELSIMKFLVFILGLNLAIGFPSRAFGGIISANLRYEISEGILLTEFLLRSLLIVIFLKLGYGIIALGFIVFFVSVLSSFLYVFFAFHVSKGIRLDLRLFNRSRVAELFSYSAYTFIYRLAQILIFRVDSLVITIFIGLAQVAHYSIASTFVSYFSTFIFASVSLIGPVFSQDEGRGDIEGIRQKFFLTTKIAIYVTMFIGTMILLYSKPFITCWMGVKYLDAYPILLILVPSSVVALMQMPSSTILFSISKHKFLAYTGVIEGVLNLILSIILVRMYGIAGVALGTAIPMFFMRVLIQPIYICNVLKVSRTKYYVNSLILCSVISLAGILPIYYLLKIYVSAQYLALFILGMVQTLFYGVVIYFVGFNIKEREYLFGYVINKLKRTSLSLRVAEVKS